ncbi:MAG: ATP-binding cassette domain-containing protein [Thermodesulfobacteriota bacterium]|nr:ATP-binding cassette domain-containing protein [Thermodesulfobacteriota bacterium]
MEPAIFANGLSKQFEDLTAVDNIDLHIEPGEIFGLVGPDGAGKTTCLRMLSTIMEPTSGVAAIAGFDTQTQASKVKANLAYMSQRFGLYTDLTVWENVSFYADMYGVPGKGRKHRIEELLEMGYMLPFKKRRAGDLSGGMKQKLQLICALVHTPKVLLLDEPTNGVDPVSRRDFWQILYKLLKQDVAILVSTAYLDEAERCNRVGLLNRGSLLAVGTPSEVKGLMDGSILSIRSNRARDIRTLLEEKLDCTGVSISGDAVRIVSDNVDAIREQARDILKEKGIACEKIQIQEPTLEDVFVHVIEKSGTKEKRSQAAIQVKAPVIRGPGISHDMENAVEAHDLSRRFGSFCAVNRVNFHVPKGEIFGFLGPNGAGKSTVIRMLCGVLAPSSGTGTVLGLDIKKQPEQIKAHIGYMSQKFSLYEDLTVEENIDFYGGIYSLTGSLLEKRKAWAIDMAGLEGHRQDLTATLSAGWKQGLAMACSILHEPPIIFLDEPTSGVDPVSRRRFWALIYSMAEKRVTVFVTTHYMEEAEYCDRLALIYGGAIIAMGTPSELKASVMKDAILDIACPHPQDLMEDIASLPHVREAALFGAGIHAVVDDVKGATQAIRRELEGRNVEIHRVEQVLPGMEDVFVSLIEQRQKKPEGEQNK